MRIGIISIFRSESRHHQSSELRRLWSLSDNRHELVGEEEDADLYFLTDISGPGWFFDLRHNPIASRCPSRCFTISDSDHPMPILHGIYTSAHNKLPFRSRIRSAAYNLYPESHKNPHIENFDGKAWESEKHYLYSFQGRDSSPVRIRLFEKPPECTAIMENTTAFYSNFGNPLPGHDDFKMRYFEIMKASKFALCPRGVGAASMRLFEAMKLGVAPVIMSDSWILPEGPDWKQCAVIIPECEAGKTQAILEDNEHRFDEIGKDAQNAYRKYFSDSVYFNYLVDRALSISRSQIFPEAIFWRTRHILVSWWIFQQDLKNVSFLSR